MVFSWAGQAERSYHLLKGGARRIETLPLIRPEIWEQGRAPVEDAGLLKPFPAASQS